MNNVQLRLDILNKLYDKLVQNGPGCYFNISDNYNDITEQIFELNITYLKDKGLITNFGNDTRKGHRLSITADGIDIVELYSLGISFDEPAKESKFKSVLSKISNFTGDVAKSSVLTIMNFYINSLLQ